MKKLLKIFMSLIAVLSLSKIAVAAAASKSPISRYIQTNNMQEPYRTIYSINQLIKQLFIDKQINGQPFTEQAFENALLQLNTQQANRFYQVLKGLFDAIENVVQPGIKHSPPSQDLDLFSAINQAKIYLTTLFKIKKTGPRTNFKPITDELRNKGIQALDATQREDLESILATILEKTPLQQAQQEKVHMDFLCNQSLVPSAKLHDTGVTPLQLAIMQNRVQEVGAILAAARAEPYNRERGVSPENYWYFSDEEHIQRPIAAEPPPAEGARAAAAAGAGAGANTADNNTAAQAESAKEKQLASDEAVAAKDTAQTAEDAKIENLFNHLIWRAGKFEDDQAFIKGWKEFLPFKERFLQLISDNNLILRDYINAMRVVKPDTDNQYPFEARFKPVKGEDKIKFERERITLIEGYWNHPKSNPSSQYDTEGAFPIPIAHEQPWEGQEEFLMKLLRIQHAALKELLKQENLRARKVTSAPRIFINASEPRFFFFTNGSDCRLGCWRGISEGTAPHFIDPNSLITWQGMLFHYIGKHNVIPSREFYRYIMNFPEELLQKMEKDAQSYAMPGNLKQIQGKHWYLTE